MLLSLPFFGSLTVQSTICYPVTQPTITAQATTVDSFTTSTILKGDASAQSTITVIINGHDFASLTADQQSRYQVQVPIVPGNNTFSLVSSNSCSSELSNPYIIAAPLASVTNTSASTQTASVTLNTPQTTTKTTAVTKQPDRVVVNRNAPAITLTSDQSDHDATIGSFYLTGKTDKPSMIKISVNDKVVATIKEELTSFGIAVPLESGNNTIAVTATSSDGQWSKHQLSVLYNDPTVTSWYESTPAKVVVGGVDIALLLLIIVLVFI